MKQLLTQYKELNKALTDFRATHKEVFDTYDAMLTTIDDVTNKIKVEAREGKEDVIGDGVVVKVIRKWKKWYDYLSFTAKERKLLDEEGGVKHDVIKEVVERLVDAGTLPRETQAKAFKEEEMSPAVSIQLTK